MANFTPLTVTISSSALGSSRATPKIGPPHPKPLTINLTADLFFSSKFFTKASFVLSSKIIFIIQPPYIYGV